MFATPPHFRTQVGIHQTAYSRIQFYAKGKVVETEGILHTQSYIRLIMAHFAIVWILQRLTICVYNHTSFRITLPYGSIVSICTVVLLQITKVFITTINLGQLTDTMAGIQIEIPLEVLCLNSLYTQDNLQTICGISITIDLAGIETGSLRNLHIQNLVGIQGTIIAEVQRKTLHERSRETYLKLGGLLRLDVCIYQSRRITYYGIATPGGLLGINLLDLIRVQIAGNGCPRTQNLEIIYKLRHLDIVGNHRTQSHRWVEIRVIARCDGRRPVVTTCQGEISILGKIQVDRTIHTFDFLLASSSPKRIVGTIGKNRTCRILQGIDSRNIQAIGRSIIVAITTIENRTTGIDGQIDILQEALGIGSQHISIDIILTHIPYLIGTLAGITIVQIRLRNLVLGKISLRTKGNTSHHAQLRQNLIIQAQLTCGDIATLRMS